MKYANDSDYADPEKAARKLLEIANTVEAVQDGRIHIEKINSAPTKTSTIKIANPITRIITSPVTRCFADSVMAETLHGAVV